MLIKRLKRWLYISHRWLGIVTCLLFATWFVSGLVMMYVGFPALTETERRSALPSLALDAVRVSPTDALRAAGQTRYPRDFRLGMLNTEPVYRITGWDGLRRTLSAADGRSIGNVSPEQALAVTRHHAQAVQPELVGTVDRDQWTVTARYDPLRPFYNIALGDAAGTQLYVSSRTGEIALDTNRHERIWNWFGAIPHWIYLTPLRAQADLWRDVVLWVSGIAILGAVSGLWVGLLRLRPRGYASGAVTPYRGWAAWHHLSGLIGGLTLLTFIVSGWLSMNPNRWFGPRVPSQEMLERYVGLTSTDLRIDVDALQSVLRPGTVETRFAGLAGQPFAIVLDRSGRHDVAGWVLEDASGPTHQDVLSASRQLLPAANLWSQHLLVQEDSYWYSHHQSRPLPVLRVKFDDVEATWFHIDPQTGDVLGRLDQSGRSYRWLFNALHSFDFWFLLHTRPTWDILLWLLSMGGLVISSSGVVIGWRRLRRSR